MERNHGGSRVIFCSPQPALQIFRQVINHNLLDVERAGFQMRFAWIASHSGMLLHDTPDIIGKNICY